MKHVPVPQGQSLYDDYFVRRLVPADHPLLEIDREVDFSFVRELVADLYSPDRGREAVDPALLLRLCFLQSYYNLSDRDVISRAQTDLALRVFLHLGLEDELPHPTMLTVFRRRLGQERFREVFNRSVAAAVERGLVSGRLVMVDSYGIVADVAIPRLRRLLMRVVRRGLLALEGFGMEEVGLWREWEALLADESWVQSKQLRERDLAAWFGLAQRVRDTLTEAPVGREQEPAREAILALLSRVLQRQHKPNRGQRRDTLVSDVDPDARWSTRERGKKAFVGYKQQIAVDDGSQIITAAQVTAGNVDDTEAFEGLVEGHEGNTGRAPEGVAGDSGYSSGANRRKLKRKGIGDYIAAPKPKGHRQGKLSAADFEPQFDDDGVARRVRCPAGRVAEGGKWDAQEAGWTFYFTQGQCAGCALRERCTKGKRGRAAFVSAYWREHQEARARQRQADFVAAQVARLGIERTFAYQQRRSGQARARYRGLGRVAIQVLLSCFTVNVVRIARASRRTATDACCPA
jgi:IS5 family transposase